MLDKVFKRNGFLKAFSVNVASMGYLKLQVIKMKETRKERETEGKRGREEG